MVQQDYNKLQWCLSEKPAPYLLSIQQLKQRVHDLVAATSPVPALWFLSHKSVYTIGTSGKSSDVLQNDKKIPVIQTNRGGKVTYHGPGQNVIYFLLPLKQFGPTLKDFLCRVGRWVQLAFHSLSVPVIYDVSRGGGFLNMGDGLQKKIVSVGLRVSKGVVWHGISVNVNPDMSFFRSIRACGGFGDQMTSLFEAGYFHLNSSDVAAALRQAFCTIWPCVMQRTECFLTRKMHEPKVS